MAIGRIGWVACLATMFATAAVAQQSSYRPQATGTSDTYIVTVNANGVLQPTFPGSDKLSGSFFPSVSYRRSDEPARFSAPDDGISFSIIDNPTFRVGPVFRFQSGRYFADDNLLFGLKKKNYDLESGLFVEYWPLTFIRARAELRHGFREDSGLVGTLGVDWVQPFGNFVFSLGPRLNLSDKRYADRWYGIRPGEAELNGRVTPYSPGGGLNSVGVTAALTYQWNEQWATTNYVTYNRLVDDAAKSPIVTQIGSRDQFIFGMKVSYSFGFTPSW